MSLIAKNHSKKYIFFAAVLFCLNHAVSAQSRGGGYAATNQISNAGYTSILYNALNGLPTSDANCILCTDDGYIWIGGYSGILKYDGSTFERLSNGTGLTSGRALFQDSKKRVWVGTNDNGVVAIEGEKTRHYTYKNGLTSSSIRAFTEDKYGNIFIGTTSGISYINSNGLLYHLHDTRLNEEEVSKLETDSDGTIYGQTYNGSIFSIHDGIIKEFFTYDDLKMERIASILADPENAGKLYICSDSGHIYYGDFGKTSDELTKINISPIKNVQCISYECGRIWVCSSSQVGYLDTDNHLNIVNNLPITSSIGSITSDYQGNIWCTSTAQGIMKIVTNNFVNLTKESKLPNQTVNSTCLCNGLLYIGTEKGLCILDKNRREIQNKLTEYIADSRIRCIQKDKNENIWIAVYNNDKGLVCYTPYTPGNFDDGGKITVFTTANGMPTNAIRNVTVAEDNSILCGTQNGLVIIKNQQIEKIYGLDEGIKNKVILTIEENDGKIFAGSDGDGIYVITDEKVERLGLENGLTSNVVMRIKKDKKHNVLWIVTSNSLQYLKDGKIKNVSSFPYNNNYDLYLNADDYFWVLASCGIYTTSAESLLADNVTDYNLYTIANGLPSSIRANSFSELDENGNLYICCREGVTCVNINHYYEQDSPIKAGLNSIYSGKQRIYPNEKGVFVIPSTNERIKLTASVLDYSLTNPVVHFFLEGAKDNGITVNRNALSSLEYTELPYGTYKLHIQILNHNKNQILLDNAFELVKKPRFSELVFIRLLFIAVFIIILGFIAWKVIQSTVISKQYKQTQLAKEEAERANHTKSRFLSNMSQEIITPINSIMCMNEMILREQAKDVPNSYFLSIMNYSMNIHTASESLLNFINDLLEMTKIESGKLTLAETEYSVQELLRSIILPIRQKSIEKELKFTVAIDQIIPSRLYGDVGKIKQILLNLLSNALKYTDQGGFDLKISMESRTNDVCDLCITVTDTGKGMTPEQVETIFDAYSSFEKNKNNMHLKTGLGLDISRQFAELMGGVLVCRSEPGKGSQFIFTLTQKIINQTPMGKFVEQEDITTKGPYTPEFIAPDADILIASENLINLQMFDYLLKSTKVFVTRASSRQEFFDKIKENSFNVAFFDQLLFEDNEEIIDETYAKIKKINSNLPVYIITEIASSDENYYKQKGFSGTLSIPIDSGILERTIMRHLPQEMMEIPNKYTVIEDLKEIPEDMKWLYSVPEISVSEGIKNANGIGTFLFAIRLFLDTIDQNAEIVEKAYTQGDFNAYRIRNGIICTSARIVGAVKLFELSAKMEQAFKHNDRLYIAANTQQLLDEYKSYKKSLSRLNEHPQSNLQDSKGAQNV